MNREVGGMQRPRTVLIVDDDAGARGFTGDALRLFGCKPLEAASGAQALEVLTDQAVDFVVLDVLMPKMGGWETLDLLRERHPGLPVLMVSGYVGDDGIDLRERSITGFLEKPYTLEKLYEAVEALLAGRANTNVIAPSPKPE